MILMQEYEPNQWGFDGLIYGTREQCALAGLRISAAQRTTTTYGPLLVWDLSIELTSKLKLIQDRIKNVRT